MGLDQFLHDFGTGADADVAVVDAGVGVTYYQLGLQRFQKIGVAGAGGGQYGSVKQVHVGIGNVLDGDKPLQLALVIHDAQGVDLDIAHQVPGGAHAHFAVNARLFADVNVFNLGADISAQARRLHAEMLQNKASLAVDMPGAAGFVQAFQAAAVFQPGIGKGRADRVGIRVLVPDDVDAAHRFCCHVFFPSLVLFFGKLRPSPRNVQNPFQLLSNILYYSILFYNLRFLTNTTL